METKSARFGSMIFESKILCNINAMRSDPGMGSAAARKTMLENVAKALPVQRALVDVLPT